MSLRQVQESRSGSRNGAERAPDCHGPAEKVLISAEIYRARLGELQLDSFVESRSGGTVTASPFQGKGAELAAFRNSDKAVAAGSLFEGRPQQGRHRGPKVPALQKGPQSRRDCAQLRRLYP
jgi:hypothetical protein